MTATHTNSKDTKTSNADLLARLAALEEENKRLKEQRNAKLSLKVSEKGCVSYYGLGRFPISLYRSQWERLLGMSDQIKAFIEANKDKLAVKE